MTFTFTKDVRTDTSCMIDWLLFSFYFNLISFYFNLISFYFNLIPFSCLIYPENLLRCLSAVIFTKDVRSDGHYYRCNTTVNLLWCPSKSVCLHWSDNTWILFSLLKDIWESSQDKLDMKMGWNKIKIK